MTIMSKDHQDIFKLLQIDHSRYLNPYCLPNKNKTCCAKLTHSPDPTKKCEELLREINIICRRHLNKRDDVLFRSKAAKVIQNFLICTRNRRAFQHIQSTLYNLRMRDPVKLLQLVNYTHATIFERSTYKLIFRLEGSTFPPKIIYRFNGGQSTLTLDSLSNGNVEIHNGNSIWYTYNVYKCIKCKTTVNYKSHNRQQRNKRTNKQKQYWIQDMYFK